MRSTYTLALGLVLTAPLAAQAVPAVAPAPGSAVDNAANSISAADVARRIGIVADDSMMGRDTPSRGLDMTAQYVADEFKRFGLKPAGDSGTYFQRYPITRTRLLTDQSSVTFTGPQGEFITLPFTSGAVLLNGAAGAEPIRGQVLLLGGVPDSAGLKPEQLKDRVVVWVLDFNPVPAAANQMLGAIMQGGARAIVAVSNRDSAAFAGGLARQAHERTGRPGGSGGPVIVEASERALAAQNAEAGQHLAQLRQSPTFVAQPMDWEAAITIRDSVIESSTAPNAIGMLEGTDKTLKAEYVVFSAHMDHIGITPGAADSINNGADDDGSGTVAVVELAEAFSRKGVRPRRSLIFMTVSGEEKGLWGSAYFSEHPTVPLGQLVADLNIDMIGRNWKDTVAVIGMEHSDLARSLQKVAAANPKLGLTAVGDQWPEENIYFRSDHYNFARKGVPILFFTSGLHEDYHKPSDSPDKIDSEKTARIAQLIFHLGQDVANSPARPQWNPESYQQIVQQEPATP
jgi:hypothetical protein